MRQRRRGADGSPKLEEGLERIDVSATRMARSIDELLDLTRMRLQNTLDLVPEPVDLVELAQRRVREHGLLAERHRITFDSAADVNEIVGLWDRARLERVLDNLLSNAVKFTPPGGEIKVQVESGGSTATLSVVDSGVGIPEEDLPWIFERFRRGSNVVGRISGTGVGLTLVKQIVEQHGGTVGVRSTPGRGSTFSVHLPLEKAAETAQPPAQPTDPRPTRRRYPQDLARRRYSADNQDGQGPDRSAARPASGGGSGT